MCNIPITVLFLSMNYVHVYRTIVGYIILVVPTYKWMPSYCTFSPHSELTRLVSLLDSLRQEVSKPWYLEKYCTWYLEKYCHQYCTEYCHQYCTYYCSECQVFPHCSWSVCVFLLPNLILSFRRIISVCWKIHSFEIWFSMLTVTIEYW